MHLMHGPEGNSFVFLRVLMFPETKSRETQGLERLPVLGTSALTTRPPRLPVYIEYAGYLYTNCDVKWQTCMFASWQTCISRAAIKGRSL